MLKKLVYSFHVAVVEMRIVLFVSGVHEVFKCTDVHLHDNAVKRNTAAILADRRSLAGSNMSDLEENF